MEKLAARRKNRRRSLKRDFISTYNIPKYGRMFHGPNKIFQTVIPSRNDFLFAFETNY